MMINAKLRCAFGAALILSLLLATSCSSNGSAAAAAVDATSNASTTVTIPAASTPPPPVTTTVVAAGLGGEADIADNFDASTGLEPMTGPQITSIDPDGAHLQAEERVLRLNFDRPAEKGDDLRQAFVLLAQKALRIDGNTSEK